MNEFNKKGVEFLNALRLLVNDKHHTNCNSLFDTLDNISLKNGLHLGLKLANEVGMGDESAFYTFMEKDIIKEDEINNRFPQLDNNELFKDITARSTKMGAWQLYLLFISPTILPTFWHGGYINRTYFFDLSYKKEYTDIEPMFGQGFWMKTKKIPEPTVEFKDSKYIIKCAYWNDWEGLMLETFKCSIKENGNVKHFKSTARTLYKYDCGVCF